MYVYIYIFCVVVEELGGSCTVIYLVFLPNVNNLHTVVGFHVFLFNTNNYMVSGNYFYLIIVIGLQTVIWNAHLHLLISTACQLVKGYSMTGS